MKLTVLSSRHVLRGCLKMLQNHIQENEVKDTDKLKIQPIKGHK